MAKRREHRLWTNGLVIALLAASGPLVAQTTPVTNNSATSAPAPADGNLIGPPQLRDFTLNGTVTRRAEPFTPAPNGTPPPTTRAPIASATPVVDAPTGRAPSTASPNRAPATAAISDRSASAGIVVRDLPPPSPADSIAGVPGFGDAPLATATPDAAPDDDGTRWPWLLAALAAALAAGFMVWRKRHAAAQRLSYAGVSDLAASPDSSPAPLPRAMPVPQRAPAPRAPAPAAPRVVGPRPASPPAIDGGIVSTGLRPKLSFELRPIRAETDDKLGAALLFDVVVTNNGHAPARDVLVEAQLLNAGPRQDEEIGRFFREPVGQGERLPVIPPMGHISLKTRLSIPGDKMSPIEIDGRQLFVPLVAFNALYRWNGGDQQDSASFLVGRGKNDGGKMAPFRLDQGAKSWTGLDARPHSMGLQKEATVA